MSEIPADIATIAGAAASEFFARAAEGEGEADIIIDLVERHSLAERQRIVKMIERGDWPTRIWEETTGDMLENIVAAILSPAEKETE
jgi:hypothetical protein